MIEDPTVTISNQDTGLGATLPVCAHAICLSRMMEDKPVGAVLDIRGLSLACQLFCLPFASSPKPQPQSINRSNPSGETSETSFFWRTGLSFFGCLIEDDSQSSELSMRIDGADAQQNEEVCCCMVHGLCNLQAHVLYPSCWGVVSISSQFCCPFIFQFRCPLSVAVTEHAYGC